VLTAASHTGLWPHGLVRSPLRGPAGNVEFLAWLRQEAAPHSIEQFVTLLGLDRIQV
jgi:23S rRNA (cytidine1920-2'-O)/16S rRNA (cytidine1409-2'-O)-methyltransferase